MYKNANNVQLFIAATPSLHTDGNVFRTSEFQLLGSNSQLTRSHFQECRRYGSNKHHTQ